MAEWQNRPLDRIYPVIFIDAMVVKIRDGQVANRPVYCAVGVTVDGQRDILGLVQIQEVTRQCVAVGPAVGCQTYHATVSSEIQNPVYWIDGEQVSEQAWKEEYAVHCYITGRCLM